MEFEQKIFENPGKEYRGMPFWAWNAALNQEQMKRQIQAFKEMGFGGFYMHARVGLATEYLSEEFFDGVRLCIREAQDREMACGIYDEDRWPSGYGGGRVTRKRGYRARHLLFTRVPYGQNADFKPAKMNPNFVTAVRTEAGEFAAKYDICLDEAGNLKEYRMLKENEIPGGVLWYAYVEENPVSYWYNGEGYVDVLNKAAMDEFLNSTHDEYFRRFGENFGTVMPSIFTDEPHMTFMTELEDPSDETDQFLPWTLLMEEEFKARFGCSLLEHLPELFWERADGSRKIRYWYHELLAQLFDEAYVKNISSWCSRHHIASTGHFLFEETLQQQNRSDGDLMRMYRDLDEPGMDLLFNMVALTTAKQIQSVTRQYGKDFAMSEEYGGTNWTFAFRDYKFQSDWQAALGINKRVPHLSLMSLQGEAKRDFPASIFYQAPWYKKYAVLEDYFARINYLLSLGKPCVRVAVLHPLESYWVMDGPASQTGKRREQLDSEFQKLTEWLLLGQVDFDYLDEALIEELYTGEHSFGQMQYDLIFVPNVVSVRKSTVQILTSFEREGGKVVFLGERPGYLEGVPKEGLLSQGGVQAAFCEDEVEKLAGEYRRIHLSENGETPLSGYLCSVRELEGAVFAFCCPGVAGCDLDEQGERRIGLSISGAYQSLLQIDAKTGAAYRIPCSVLREKDRVRTEAELSIWGNTSFALLWTEEIPEDIVLKERPAGKQQGPGQQIPEAELVLEEPNVVLLDQPEFSVDGEEWQDREEILRIDAELRKKFGFFERNALMAQPYTRKPEKETHTLRLRYELESLTEGQEMSLGLEGLEDTAVFWNGKAAGEVTGFYIDEGISTVRLGTLQKGKNVLELEIRYHPEFNPEAVYLLGQVGVCLKGRDVTLTELPGKVSFGDLAKQGFPFYGGNVRYCFSLETGEAALTLHVPKYQGALVGLEIDGRETRQYVIDAPYRFSIEGLAPGRHSFALVLYGNRANTLGHLHNCNPLDDHISRPGLWRTTGKDWSYEYRLQPFGILEPPEAEG